MHLSQITWIQHHRMYMQDTLTTNDKTHSDIHFNFWKRNHVWQGVTQRERKKKAQIYLKLYTFNGIIKLSDEKNSKLSLYNLNTCNMMLCDILNHCICYVVGFFQIKCPYTIFCCFFFSISSFTSVNSFLLLVQHFFLPLSLLFIFGFARRARILFHSSSKFHVMNIFMCVCVLFIRLMSHFRLLPLHSVLIHPFILLSFQPLSEHLTTTVSCCFYVLLKLLKCVVMILVVAISVMHFSLFFFTLPKLRKMIKTKLLLLIYALNTLGYLPSICWIFN